MTWIVYNKFNPISRGYASTHYLHDVDSKLTERGIPNSSIIRIRNDAAHKIFGALQRTMEWLPTDMLKSSTDRG